jgi:YegS/Rv2252/BmrU family lipid kinase
MSLNTLVIVNPASRNGATGRSWPELRSALDRVLDRWDNQFTLGPGDATRLARQAVGEGYEMIVAVGGDGTNNEVVSGLLAEGGERVLRQDLVLGVVRQGTGGDFARALGLTGKLPEAVAHLAGEGTRPIDLGVIDYAAHGGDQRQRAFLNIASFGLSGLVDEKVNQSSKALGGTASFMVGLGKALVGYRPEAVRISVDGQPFYEGPLVTCAVANGRYFGGGMHFAPKAAIDDGMFDVVAQVKTGLREVVSIADLYSGKLIDWPSVRSGRGRSVEAEALKNGARVLLDVDGEQPGTLPARFRVLPAALRLKV